MKAKSKRTLKFLGLSFLLIPTLFLSIFLFGELSAGIVSGFIHLVQITPIIIVAFFAWKKPCFGGIFLLLMAMSLGILYALTVHFPLMTIMLVETILFMPMLLAGIFFILASKNCLFFSER